VIGRQPGPKGATVHCRSCDFNQPVPGSSCAMKAGLLIGVGAIGPREPETPIYYSIEIRRPQRVSGTRPSVGLRGAACLRNTILGRAPGCVSPEHDPRSGSHEISRPQRVSGTRPSVGLRGVYLPAKLCSRRAKTSSAGMVATLPASTPSMGCHYARVPSSWWAATRRPPASSPARRQWCDRHGSRTRRRNTGDARAARVFS
jgi:hypothetical protein